MTAKKYFMIVNVLLITAGVYFGVSAYRRRLFWRQRFLHHRHRLVEPRGGAAGIFQKGGF
jgi:hypothetical protein